MKIVLFNIADHLNFSEYSESLGQAYLKSYFERHSKFKDKVEISIETKDIPKMLFKKCPDIIGMSVATEYYLEAIKLASMIKKSLPEAVLIIGGYHITNMPQTFNQIFDFGVLGEGEVTFLELVNAIFNKEKKENFRKINGLIFFDEFNNLVKTAPRELISNLDTIPFPYRDKKRKIYTHIMTSRGCPFSCAFCASSAFWGRTIRYNSVEYVINEMLELITKYGVRHITIWDDLFIGNLERLRKIAQLIKQQNRIFGNITFGVSARPNLIAQNQEIPDIFKKINVIRVSLGFESGSNRMLKKLKGESASLENNQKAIELLKKYKFLINGGFIIGSPEERVDDLEETYNFIINSGLNGGYAGLAVPYPNTKFWSYAEKRGLVNENMDFGKLKLTTNFQPLKDKDFILLSEELDKEDLVKYGIKMQKYFSKAELKIYFSLRILNLKIIKLFLNNPLIFMPYIIRATLSFIRNMGTHKIKQSLEVG